MSAPEDYVICKICGGKFSQITRNHLKYRHNLSLPQYKQMFPNTSTISQVTKRKLKNRSSWSKGKTGNPESPNYDPRIPSGWMKDLSGDPDAPNYDPRMECIMGENNPAKRPEVRIKISKAKTGMLRPDVSARQMGKNNPACRPEVARKIGKTISDIWANKDSTYHTEKYRRNHSQGLIGREFSDEHRRNLSINKTEWWATLPQEERKEFSKKARRKIILWWNNLTPEEKLQHNEKIWKSWELLSPEQRTERLYNSLYKGSKRPNVSESKLIPILEPFGFRYTGGDPPDETGRRPDFTHHRYPLIVEYDGGGGHDPKVPWVPENQPELDNQRDSDYQTIGRSVLRIYPTNLKKGQLHIQQNIVDWMISLNYSVEWNLLDMREWFE